MPTPPQFTALAIGDAYRAEFQTVFASLGARLSTQSVATIAAALSSSTDLHASPDLVVLFENRPDEFTQDEVERLRSAWPLAGMIVVLGSWCEAESRSGRPLAGTWRVFWHQWSPRFEIEMALWQAGRCPAWGLPATTLEEERILRSHSPKAGGSICPTDEIGTVIAVRTLERELAGLLADVCRAAGRRAAWFAENRLPEGEIEAVIDDIVLPATRDELAARFRSWLPRPIIALADYPRAEDVEAALAAGATALLSKPLVVEELIWQLERQSIARTHAPA